MRKEIFEQPRAVADSLLGRRTASGLLQLDEMRLSDQELRDIDKIIIIACGTSFYAGMVAKYAIEHWTRVPVEVELSSEFRYRDPILDYSTLVVAISQSGETADTLQAIRHARDPALEGAGDLQHQRLDHPARVRRGHLHPRRPGDRGRVDQGVPDPAGRLLPARALPGPGQGHPVRRRDRPGDDPARGDPVADRDGARVRRLGLRAGPVAGRHPVGAVRRPARRLPGGARGRAEAQGARLPARRGVRRRRAQARADRADRGRHAGAVRRTSPRPRPAPRQDAQRHPGGPRPRRPHDLPGRGGRRADRAVRRRADPAAGRSRCCSSRWSPSSRCSCSRASWPP